MTKINFIDLKNTFYSTNSIENDKNITETLTDIEDIDITTTNKNSNKSIEKLYNYILNSLNYQSTTSYLINCKKKIKEYGLPKAT